MKAAIALLCAGALVGAPTFTDIAVAQSTTTQVNITNSSAKSGSPHPLIKHEAIKHAAIKHPAIKHAAKSAAGGAGGGSGGGQAQSKP